MADIVEEFINNVRYATVQAVERLLGRPLNNEEIRTVLNTIAESKDAFEQFFENVKQVPGMKEWLYSGLILELTDRSLRKIRIPVI
jgi:hypothetical protein